MTYKTKPLYSRYRAGVMATHPSFSNPRTAAYLAELREQRAALPPHELFDFKSFMAEDWLRAEARILGIRITPAEIKNACGGES